MDFSKINDYVNPLSSGSIQARKDFKGLTTVQKITTVVLSIFAGLLTLGFGGFATFKAMVDTFKTASASSGTNATPLENLSMGDLLAKSLGIPLVNNIAALDSKFSVEQTKINDEIAKRMQAMKGYDRMQLLDRCGIYRTPEQFALIANYVAEFSNSLISEVCEDFERCTWPSQKLKDWLLPQLVGSMIMKKGIKKNNWDLSEAFLFTSGKKTSPYLAKSIGFAIDKATDDQVKTLREKMKVGSEQDESAASVTIIIKSSSINTASILPHLKSIPGLTLLVLSENMGLSGKKENPDTFGDEHIHPLIEIYKTNPYLKIRSFKVNTDRMTTEGQCRFYSELEQHACQTRREQPTFLKLLQGSILLD